MTKHRGVIARLRELWAWLNDLSAIAIFLMGIGLLVGAPVFVHVVFFTLLSGGSYHLYYTGAGAPRWLIIANALGKSLFLVGTASGLGLIALAVWRLVFKAGRWACGVKPPAPNQDTTR